MWRSLVISLVPLICISAWLPAQEEEAVASSQDDYRSEVQEASDFVIGLTALNRQIIHALDQQPTRNVIIAPFANEEGRYTRLGKYLSEQLITAISATGKYKVVDNRKLSALLKDNNLAPIKFSNSDAFHQSAPDYSNTCIVVGNFTDLRKKISVMARVIQGKSGSYVGAAIVYLRVEDEVMALLSRDRVETEDTVNNRETDIVQTTQLGRREADLEYPQPRTDERATGEVTDTSLTEDEEQKQLDKKPMPDVSGMNDLAIYREGRNQYENGRYDAAVNYFDRLIQRFPDSPLADNAVYWIGESCYRQRKWAESLANFQRVLEEYPYANKVPAAMLKRGYAQEMLGRISDAIASMEKLIRRFGDAEEADLAKRKLQLLRAERQ